MNYSPLKSASDETDKVACLAGFTPSIWYNYGMNEFNSAIVIPSLRHLIRILTKHHIEYRFLGSIIPASLNGKLHRSLGDFDLLVDRKAKDVLLTELTKLGYTQAGGMYIFGRNHMSLETLVHPTLLSIGYHFGSWQPDGSFVMGDSFIRVVIDAYALVKTRYTLYGIHFLGIPAGVVARGITISATNPKRRTEQTLIKTQKIDIFPNTYMHVTVAGFHADWIYHLMMKLFNILGAIRVRLGLAFDPWR